jgi:hypothetical protein
LRDPGWSLKWIGSLLIVTGIFMMFYLRGFRKGTAAAPPITLSAAKAAPPRTPREEPAAVGAASRL